MKFMQPLVCTRGEMGRVLETEWAGRESRHGRVNRVEVRDGGLTGCASLGRERRGLGNESYAALSMHTWSLGKMVSPGWKSVRMLGFRSDSRIFGGAYEVGTGLPILRVDKPCESWTFGPVTDNLSDEAIEELKSNLFPPPRLFTNCLTRSRSCFLVPG